jgi:hypothetical protein
VAHHLLESRVILGERAVILGCGNWARRVGQLMDQQGAHIRVFPLDDQSPRPEYADEWWPGWTPTGVHGKARVNEIVVNRDGLEERLQCDAVILAARMKPLRNIDGAIFENETQAVTFAQLASDSSSLEQRFTHASQVATKLIKNLRRERV